MNEIKLIVAEEPATKLKEYLNRYCGENADDLADNIISSAEHIVNERYQTDENASLDIDCIRFYEYTMEYYVNSLLYETGCWSTWIPMFIEIQKGDSQNEEIA